MTSIFRVDIASHFKLATRPNGVEARLYLLQSLEQYDKLEVDFAGADPSPSFADECIGILCRNIGWDEFRKRIQMLNLSDSARSLMKHVISRRRNQERPEILHS